MNIKAATVFSIIIVSTTASASPHLTPQQCNDYPFKSLKKEVTQAQLQQELAELEALGYDPTDEAYGYPRNLIAAHRDLANEYARDCTSGGAPIDNSAPM